MPQQRPWKFLETPLRLDVPALSDSTIKSFALIEPWYLVRQEFQHESVATVVDMVIRQADLYVGAILSSVKTAKDGCTFGGDAISLCEFIASRNHTPNELKEFVQSMLDMASNGRRRAQKTSETFRGVRVELIKICRKICYELPKIEVDLGTLANTQFVSLPSPLSHDELAKDVHETQEMHYKASVRPVENKSASEIIAQLQHAQNDLEDLACHITAFADWWDVQVVGLRSLVHVIPQIQTDGSNPLRMVEVRRRWERIIDQYLMYSSKIGLIQDCYPDLVKKCRIPPATEMMTRSRRVGTTRTNSNLCRRDHQSASPDIKPATRFLSSVSPPEAGIDSLTESTLKVFSVLRPWFEHPLIAELVESIVQQGNAYCSALASSLNAADIILKNICGNIQLCDDIAEGQAPAGRIAKSLQSMIVSANEAHKEALISKAPFWNLHNELMENSGRTHDIEVQIRKEGRNMDRRSFMVVQMRFLKVKADVNILTDNVNKYDKFWGSLKTDFGSLETVIRHVPMDGSNPLRTYSVRRRWVQAQSQINRYMHRINIVEDIYPELRLRAMAWKADGNITPTVWTKCKKFWTALHLHQSS